MIHRSEVFKTAWNAYRLARPCFFATGDEIGKRRFLRDLFARLLRTTWADAKKAARADASQDTARQFVAAQRRVAAAKAAAMEPGERSTAISRAHDELATLDYSPLGVRTSQRRADLRATLSALTAA